MIIINFKNYTHGEEVLKLAQTIEQYLVNAVVAVPAIYLKTIAAKTALNVYAQHTDLANEKGTGFTNVIDVRASGASGVILNHSEHPLKKEILQKTISACKKVKLVTLVCVPSLVEAKKMIALKPDMLAFEDPALISTGKSITQYQSHTVAQFTKLLKNTSIIPICGAGISTYHDVDSAYALGCKGVLLASAIAQVKNPVPLLKELATWTI